MAGLAGWYGTAERSPDALGRMVTAMEPMSPVAEELAGDGFGLAPIQPGLAGDEDGVQRACPGLSAAADGEDGA